MKEVTRTMDDATLATSTSAPSAASRYPSARTAWWSMTVIFLASVVSVIDRGILNIVVDPVRHDLGISDVQMSLLQGLAFGIFYATFGIPMGLLADRFSRRVLLALGILIWSLATMGGGLAQTFGWLFTSRLLVGFGEAALGPAVVSLIADLFPPERRGRPLSIFLVGQAIANGLAISLTSLILSAAAQGRFAGIPVLQSAAPWRAAFMVCGAIGLVVAILIMTTVEPVRKGAQGAPAAMTSFADKLRFLKSNASLLVPLYLGFAFCFLAAYGAGAWAPTMLIRAFRIGPAEIGTWLGPFMMAFSVAGPLVGGMMIDRFTRKGQEGAKLAMLIVAPILAMPAALAIFAPSPMTAMLLVASSSAIFGVIGTVVFATLQSVMPAAMRGSAISIAGLINTLIGAAVGPLLIATLTEHGDGSPAMIGYSIAEVAIPALATGSILFMVARRRILRSLRTG